MRPSRARVCAAQWLVVGCLFRRPLDAASTAPGRCVAAATMDAGIVFALGALLCAALNDIVFKKAVGAGLSVGWFASMIGTTWGLVQVCGRFRPQSPSLPLPSLPPPSPPPPPPAIATRHRHRRRRHRHRHRRHGRHRRHRRHRSHRPRRYRHRRHRRHRQHRREHLPRTPSAPPAQCAPTHGR